MCAEKPELTADEIKQSIIDTILGVQYKDRSCAAALSFIAWINDEFAGNEAGKELMRQKLRADLDKIA